jgi:hypothetical protein
MIFRLSRQLAQKIKVAPKVSAPFDPNPFADWSAHLFMADRTQYIILANTASLYTIVMDDSGPGSPGPAGSSAVKDGGRKVTCPAAPRFSGSSAPGRLNAIGTVETADWQPAKRLGAEPTKTRFLKGATP